VSIEFLCLAAALIVGTLALLLRPWQRRASGAASDAATLNAALYREQLAELENERTAGTLAESDATQARDELERRLLEDVSASEQTAAGTTASSVAMATGHRTAWVLSLILPVAAAGLYYKLGTPQAMQPQADVAASQTITDQQVEQMVVRLAAKLAKQPDDPKGWAMLGRSYHTMGRAADAVKAFEHVGPALLTDATLLATYADALASVSGGKLAGRPTDIIEQALLVDPDHPMALELAAAAAAQRKDSVAAAGYWTHLLKRLPPDSDDARWVQSQLAALQSDAKPVASTQAQKGTAEPSSSTAPEAVTGHVSLAPALASKVNAGDTLFLFARAEQGSRMPLAILRLTANQLPMDFKLDDSLAMSPNARLSGAQKIVVEARVSRSGNAMPAAGDLYGMSPVITPGAHGLQIVIDQVMPVIAPGSWPSRTGSPGQQ
jgi:cytochrome c-type biogenesis protein CcmH